MTGIHSALQHDQIMEANDQERLLINREGNSTDRADRYVYIL